MNSRHDLLRKIHAPVFFSLGVMAINLLGQDAELTNYKSGIDVTWGGTKGTDYYEEYFYHDKLLDDHKVVYLRSSTTITMANNSRNVAFGIVSNTGTMVTIGINGKDGAPNTGDEGIIRYKIDRDRQYYYLWADDYLKTKTARVLPAYVGPFTLASQEYEPGVPVVGTTGSNGVPVTSRSTHYHRGIVDSFGDEWHVLAYGNDDNVYQRAVTSTFIDQAYYASDGKTVLLVVNPKTPCFTARATGSGQFYTTPPKAYFTPKIVPQTTYISGTVTIELRDINGNNVFYRINGGSYTNAGSNTVTLNQDNFNSGTNTLEYYYQGNEAFVKTRVVVKAPPFPSASEPHGNFLWVDNDGFAKILSRITRAPYLSYFKNYKERADVSGQEQWDLYSNQGRRYTGSVNLQGNSYSLKNAFVAKVEGYGYTRAGASRSHGQYAKAMLLELSRNIDPLGFELSHSSDSIPNRELQYRGYYDSVPLQEAIFAYDIMIANFKSTQVAGGITPIEDHFIRDRFAGFAYEAMQWTADVCVLGEPLMWGGARIMTAVSIAMILSEYSTPYFGTSGFGSVQTTYPLCPYENDQLTWKRALFDGNAPKSAYPNYTWSLGLSDNGQGKSLILGEGDILGGKSYPLGTWRDKAAYFSFGLMGRHLCTWANMAKLWGGNKTDSRLEIVFEKATAGTLIGAVDPAPQTGSYFPLLTLINDRWPAVAAAQRAIMQSVPSSDNKSDDKALQDAGIFGFAWYDDGVGGPVPPPPPTVTAPSNAKVSISVSGP